MLLHKVFLRTFNLSLVVIVIVWLEANGNTLFELDSPYEFDNVGMIVLF